MGGGQRGAPAAPLPERWCSLGPPESVLRRGAGSFAAHAPRCHRPRSSTPFAGMTRIRFEGLRSPALSALSRSPVVAAKLHPGGLSCTLVDQGAAWEAWAMLRLLRERAVTGAVSVTLLVMMVALSAPSSCPWCTGCSGCSELSAFRSPAALGVRASVDRSGCPQNDQEARWDRSRGESSEPARRCWPRPPPRRACRRPGSSRRVTTRRPSRRTRRRAWTEAIAWAVLSGAVLGVARLARHPACRAVLHRVDRRAAQGAPALRPDRRGRPSPRAGRRAGRPGGRATGRRAAPGRRAPRPAGRRCRRGAARRRRPRSRRAPPRRASCASRGRRARRRTASTSCTTCPGLQSVASATVTPGVEQAAGVGVGRAGRELGTRQQGGDDAGVPQGGRRRRR